MIPPVPAPCGSRRRVRLSCLVAQTPAMPMLGSNPVGVKDTGDFSGRSKEAVARVSVDVEGDGNRFRFLHREGGDVGIQ